MQLFSPIYSFMGRLKVTMFCNHNKLCYFCITYFSSCLINSTMDKNLVSQHPLILSKVFLWIETEQVPIMWVIILNLYSIKIYIKWDLANKILRFLQYLLKLLIIQKLRSTFWACLLFDCNAKQFVHIGLGCVRISVQPQILTLVSRNW